MKKSVLILFHLLFWTFTTLLILLVFQVALITIGLLETGQPRLKDSLLIVNLAALLVVLPIGACIFYASYSSLHFFVKRPVRFIWIGLSYALLTLAFSLPGYLKARNHAPIHPVQGLLAMTLIIAPLLYFTIFGFLFKVFIEWIKDRKIKAELEKDKLASQLELLKSKLNPHFLFNTLNNIDVLIQEDTRKASEYLKELSGILRFMLYESNAEKIPLTKEIEYIQKYIDLQKIRTANVNFVKFEIAGDVTNKYISPMILIHFIENAFKYATNKKIEEAVAVRLKITGLHLSFFCKNHIHVTEAIPGEQNGLGIQLLKQKLDLLYGATYTLTAKEENNWYLVNLELQLNDH